MVFHGFRVFLQRGAVPVQILLQGFQIIRVHPGKRPGHCLVFLHTAGFSGLIPGASGFTLRILRRTVSRHRHHGTEINIRLLDLNRILGQGFLFDAVDIPVDPIGQRKNHGDADDADTAGECHQQSAGFLRQQVVETQAQGSQKRHGCPAECPVFAVGMLIRERIGIRDDPAVPQVDNAGGVPLCQLRIVGDHDHQTVPGHLPEQIHDLHAGITVQRTGGFVRQQNVRIVHQRPGDGHPLHLAAGKLVRLLVKLFPQPHLLQSLCRPPPSLLLRNAGDGQRQLHVGQDRLVGNQVIALEDETDGVVPVGVPVPVPVFPGGDAVDHQIPAVIPVQAADDIQQGGLAGAAGTQNSNEFAVPEIQADAVQSVLDETAGPVFFPDVAEVEHKNYSPE